MPAHLDHTIVMAADKHAAAEFLATILGLNVGAPYGPFLPVETGNGVKLDSMDSGGQAITPQHYAFLVTEAEFDTIFDRIGQAEITYYADPQHAHAGQINHDDDGRGLYFTDPDGHGLEIITRPYGSNG